jgi:hypothetical protein
VILQAPEKAAAFDDDQQHDVLALSCSLVPPAAWSKTWQSSSYYIAKVPPPF